MRTVRISAALERKLRAWETAPDMGALMGELLALFDAHKDDKPPSIGLSYKEVVGLFRQHFGAGLALPPNPNATWIIRQVNRAKELGLDGDSIRALAEVVKKRYPRPPYDFEWLLRAAPRLLHGSYDGMGEDEVRKDVGGLAVVVVTGRGAQDD